MSYKIKCRLQTIDEKIEALGANFRSLQRGYFLYKHEINNNNKWSVTFVLKGHLFITPELDTPHKVLDFALLKVKDDSIKFKERSP